MSNYLGVLCYVVQLNPGFQSLVYSLNHHFKSQRTMLVALLLPELKDNGGRGPTSPR